MPRPSIRRVTGLWLASSLAVWGSAIPAYSHDQVVETTPAAGEQTSDNPVTVQIVTSGQLLDLSGNSAGFAITVTDTDGLFYGNGCVEVAGPALSTVVEMGTGGPYTVTYQYVSGDGHTLSGRYSFDYSMPESSLPAAGQSAPPVCGQPPVYPDASTSEIVDQPADSSADQEEPGPVETPELAPSTGSGPAWVMPAVISVIAIAILATSTYLWVSITRSRRRPD